MSELQDIFNQYGDDYRNNHKLPLHILKTMAAIESCRTSTLGGHLDVCDECGNTRISYNSCRNRHCPKCQTLAKEKYFFQCFLDKLHNKKWVVYCKPPFSSPEHVLEYLGRYTHRVALPNNRIVKFEDGLVTFKWRDYKDGNKQKLMTVTAEEFIRRFLMHILPDKFVKIRHYGILSNRNRNSKLKLCKGLTGMAFKKKSISLSKLSAAEIFKRLTGIDFNKCPQCKNGRMMTTQTLYPRNSSPPGVRKTA